MSLKGSGIESPYSVYLETEISWVTFCSGYGLSERDPGSHLGVL
jgi:hypothetical protein